jgi:hypothetical protein
MEMHTIASLFTALRDGELQDMVLEAGNLQFQVTLPRLAALRGEGFRHFLCSLQDVRQFSFQPFRNESMEIKDLKQLNKLQIKIERAEVGEGPVVKVWCAHKGGAEGRLTVRAEKFSIWDEAFDAVSAGELAMLRASGRSEK